MGFGQPGVALTSDINVNQYFIMLRCLRVEIAIRYWYRDPKEYVFFSLRRHFIRSPGRLYVYTLHPLKT